MSRFYEFLTTTLRVDLGKYFVRCSADLAKKKYVCKNASNF